MDEPLQNESISAGLFFRFLKTVSAHTKSRRKE
jgi:hypothetical protein